MFRHVSVRVAAVLIAGVLVACGGDTEVDDPPKELIRGMIAGQAPYPLGRTSDSCTFDEQAEGIYLVTCSTMRTFIVNVPESTVKPGNELTGRYWKRYEGR